MVSLIFDDLLEKGFRAGQIPARTDEARKWFRTQSGNVRRVNENKQLFADQTRLVGINQLLPGSMYMFHYDPKHKETLPYYDTLPLIFPFAKTEDGFLGINFHYIPPRLRAKLMDGLYEYTNNKKYNATTRVRMNYQLLKSVANLRYYKPCVKRYLSAHVKSRLLLVMPEHWDIALFLPAARFKKASILQVHSNSRKMIN